MNFAQVLARTRIPALYVTHDQEEAFKIGDRIVLLHDGLIVRQGAPRDLWLRPGSRWVAEFLGLGSILSGRIVGRAARVQTAFGVFPLRCRARPSIGRSGPRAGAADPCPSWCTAHRHCARCHLSAGWIPGSAFQRAILPRHKSAAER